MWKDYVILVFLSAWILPAKCQTKVGDQCDESYTGSIGTCTLVKDCESARKAAEGNGVQPTFCAYSAFSPTLVCCLDNSNVLNIVGPKKEERPVWSGGSGGGGGSGSSGGSGSKRVCVRKCEEYSERVIQKIGYVPLQRPNEFTVAKCDYMSTGLIVGGEKANRGEFPHMVAIGWTSTTDYNFVCGGSLISPKFVLTAGHCIKFGGADPAIARLGDQNIDPTVDDGAQHVDVPIRKVIKHPNYDPPMTYNDIALMELARSVQFSDSIRPACLWTQRGFGPHTKALATGWGVIDDRTNEKSNELLKVSLSLLKNDYCDPLLSNYRSERKWTGFSSSQMCAGELRGGKDTCQGDSGGPLQVVRDDNQCIFYVMGVVSFGRYCAVESNPGVYTRVSSYLNWIEQTVWPGE